MGGAPELPFAPVDRGLFFVLLPHAVRYTKRVSCRVAVWSDASSDSLIRRSDQTDPDQTTPCLVGLMCTTRIVMYVNSM